MTNKTSLQKNNLDFIKHSSIRLWTVFYCYIDVYHCYIYAYISDFQGDIGINSQFYGLKFATTHFFVSTDLWYFHIYHICQDFWF